tara:strand:+ start:3439 stop:4221 length:783 start_codon:yes stop_codon:yes gene_type:complete
MLKEKFKMNLRRIGGSFSHAHSSTLWKTSEKIIYTDSAEDSISIDHFSPATYAWLHESKSIIPQAYEAAKQNKELLKSQYKAVFTHDNDLIESDPEFFKMVPACGFWIEDVKVHPKSKLLSFITSNKVMCEGHRYRLGWLEKLGGSCDVYGKGINDIDKKEEALNDYYFSIAIENGKYDTYFTEKILDCFATGTIPVYYGTEKIVDYFNKDGIIMLTDDFDISQLSPELYESKKEAVMDNFERVKKYDTVEDYIYREYLS